MSYPMATQSKRVLLAEMPRTEQIRALGPILAGYDRFHWPVDKLLRLCGVELEVAIYDHLACSGCRAATAEQCRSSLGQMRYSGLIREGCIMYQVPCFGAIECGGPIEWAARYARRINAGPDWVREDDIRPRVTVVRPVQPAKTVADMTARIATRFRTGGAAR